MQACLESAQSIFLFCLSDNAITKLDHLQFKNLTKLCQLYLQNNKVCKAVCLFTHSQIYWQQDQVRWYLLRPSSHVNNIIRPNCQCLQTVYIWIMGVVDKNSRITYPVCKKQHLYHLQKRHLLTGSFHHSIYMYFGRYDTESVNATQFEITHERATRI